MKKHIRRSGCCFLVMAILFPSSVFAAGGVANAAVGKSKMVMPSVSRDGGVTLNVENVDLTAVLKMLAMTRRVNILAGPDVDGMLSINLYDMPFEQALASIVGVSGFAFHKKDNIYYVTTMEASRSLPMHFSDLETKTFIVRNTDAEDLQKALLQFVSAAGTVALNKDQGAVIVRDSKESMRAIEALMLQMDVAPTPPNLELRSFPIMHSDPTKLEAALEPFLSPQGNLAVNIEDRMIVVQDTVEFMPLIASVVKEHDVGPQLDVRAFRLDHIDSSAMLASVSQIISKEGKVSLNEEDRTLIVRDTPAYVEMIADLIEQQDVPRRQVLISAQILRVSHDDSLDLRAELSRASYSSSNDAVSFSRDGNVDGTDVTIDDAQAFGGDMLLKTLNSNLTGFTWHGIWGNKEVFLRALATKTKVDDLAAPELLVLDGESSEMLIGKKLGYTTTVYPGENMPARETVEYLDVGTNLIVTPTIAADGLIKMQVQPKVSSGEIVNGVPQETTTQVDTTFLVGNNETIIIGGLMESINTRTRTQVPFLGDIPVLGFLFGYNTWKETKVELVVLITPRIVEARRTELMEQKIRDYTLESDIFPEAFLRIVGDVVPEDMLIDPKAVDEDDPLSVIPMVVEEVPLEKLSVEEVDVLPSILAKEAAEEEAAEESVVEAEVVEKDSVKAEDILPEMLEEAIKRGPEDEGMIDLEAEVLPAMLAEVLETLNGNMPEMNSISEKESDILPAMLEDKMKDIPVVLPGLPSAEERKK